MVVVETMAARVPVVVDACGAAAQMIADAVEVVSLGAPVKTVGDVKIRARLWCGSAGVW